jgi:hypothetical protein
MPRITFILGAGAARDGGCPLMFDFMERARFLYLTHGLPNVRQSYERVDRFRRYLARSYSKSHLDFDNIETVFSAAEMAETIGGWHDGDSPFTDDVRNDLVELILVTLQATQSFPVLEYQNGRRLRGPKGYDELATLINKLKGTEPPHDVDVITFNYDVGLEIALQLYGRKAAYCLDGQLPDIRDVPVYKLHGSLNWLRSENAKADKTPNVLDLEPVCSKAASGATQGVAFLNIRDAIYEHAGTYKTERLPLIVPPSDDKAQYRRSLGSVWRGAAKAIRDAESIFTVGYSLPETDIFFRQFFALASIGDTILRRFWVFDPSSQPFTRFSNLLGGYVITNPGCLEHFSLKAPQVDDVVMARLRQANGLF